MAESHDSVENHSNNLDEHNQSKEDHESDTNRLQLQVLILNLNQNKVILLIVTQGVI